MAITSKSQRDRAARIASIARQRGMVRPSGLEPRDSRAHEARAQARAGRYGSDLGVGASDPGLAAAVRAGALSSQEADELAASRRVGARYAGGRYGAQGERLDAAEMAEKAAGLRPGGELMTAMRTARRPAAATFQVEQLPAVYDPDAVKTAIQDVADRIPSTESQPAAHTVDGAVLAPGSVPAAALDQRELGRELLTLPGPSEAIELEFTHSTTMDRFVRSAAGESGPGRIWTAGEVQAGRQARIGLGPARYRMVKPNMPFGVMSLRLLPTANLLANSLPGFLVSYGVVITKIPHFLGRPPTRILSAEAVGSQPMSFAIRTADGGKIAAFTAPRNLYWSRTTSEYETQGLYPFLSTLGTDTTLRAIASSWRDNAGLVFQLITGRDANEVFQQLCTRNVLGKMLSNNAVPPSVALPISCPVGAATAPNCLVWDSATFPAVYLHRTQANDLTTLGVDERLVQGLPFDYDDCAALVPTEKHFSLVVLWGFEKVVAQAPTPAQYGTPDVWHKNGLQTFQNTTSRLRNWAVDLIVG
jgi:hypothetical protein